MISLPAIPELLRRSKALAALELILVVRVAVSLPFIQRRLVTLRADGEHEEWLWRRVVDCF